MEVFSRTALHINLRALWTVLQVEEDNLLQEKNFSLQEKNVTQNGKQIFAPEGGDGTRL